MYQILYFKDAHALCQQLALHIEKLTEGNIRQTETFVVTSSRTLPETLVLLACNQAEPRLHQRFHLAYDWIKTKGSYTQLDSTKKVIAFLR